MPVDWLILGVIGLIVIVWGGLSNDIAKAHGTLIELRQDVANINDEITEIRRRVAPDREPIEASWLVNEQPEE